MPPEPEGSVTRSIRLIHRGDRNAAEAQWRPYSRRLVGLARARLRAAPRRAADEEGVALGAFDSFFRAAEAGRSPKLEDRDDLWQVPFVIIVRKAIDPIDSERRPIRGGGRVGSLSDLADAEVTGLLGPEPPPDLVAQFEEQCRRLRLRLSEGELRSAALWKLDGHTNDEIAAKLGCVVQAAERKLWRIRNLWSEGGDA